MANTYGITYLYFSWCRDVFQKSFVSPVSSWYFKTGEGFFTWVWVGGLKPLYRPRLKRFKSCWIFKSQASHLNETEQINRDEQVNGSFDTGLTLRLMTTRHSSLWYQLETIGGYTIYVCI